MTLKEKILALPHVEGISDERGMGDGIWVYYREGFKSTIDRMGALHQEHEDTWSKVYYMARRAMQCSCTECETIKADKAANQTERR